MEGWQVNYIQKNLHDLVTLTTCNVMVQVILRQMNILSEDDVERLRVKGDREGDIAKSFLFYEILLKRKGGYAALLEALRETNQTGSLHILQEGIREQNESTLVNDETLVVVPSTVNIPTENVVTQEENLLVTGRDNSSGGQLGHLISLDGTDITYIHVKRLGQSTTSTVYQGFYGKNPAAVKRIDPKYFQLYANELNNWQDMQRTNEIGNVNIVTLYRWATIKEDNVLACYLAMELAICDLEKKVLSTKPPLFDIERRQLIEFIHGAAKGLHWIHESTNFLHRDIKPANIFIFETISGNQIAKLGDFGVSRKLSELATGTSTRAKGTFNWMSPEALKALNDDDIPFRNTRAVDIFPLGMSAHFALSLGEHPFRWSAKYKKKIDMNIEEDNIYPVSLEASNYLANHLLNWMMNKQPIKRPNIRQVVAHPLFWNLQRNKDFLLDVAKGFDVKNEATVKIALELENKYKVTVSSFSIDVNWRTRMDDRLYEKIIQRKSNTDSVKKGKFHTKEYDGEYILKLVELIRDKHVHSEDMVDDLLHEYYFGDGNGGVSEDKYFTYFLKTFPELVLFLFWFLIRNQSNLSFSTTSKYYEDFSADTIPCAVCKMGESCPLCE